ncbi:hypothetical protein HSBGL_0959 [Halapricum desulfuricans]|uniref:Uncharacterized protein n=1 Tax=Halapricum desulfuricans TaxID=2841257 RepID=A0A897NFB7_9EURY|nr:hypothetical protein [Halapricum desulfuricans]QSG11387.1 hypothetical protein HSBGL_0959 [Halapricum desulfuricans]
MAKLHIEGASDRAEVIKHYLDFIDRRDYSSLDAVMDDIYRETGLDLVNTKNMETTLAKLGLVDQQNRQQLTDYGRDVVEVLLYNDDLFFELLHFTYATAYHRNPCPDRAISWAYYSICDEFRRRAPVNFTDAKQEVVESVMERADRAPDSALDDHGPLSNTSLSNYRRFIEQLDPEVYQDGEVTLRSFAPKEIVLATIDHLYRTDVVSETIDYGDLLELSDETIDTICTILLLQEESVGDVVEHVASMDARLSLTSDYQLRVRLTDPVEINDLA